MGRSCFPVNITEMLQDSYEVQLSGRKLKSDQIRLEPVPAYKYLDYTKRTNTPLDRIGFCDSYCCENVKKRCWFTCSFSLKIQQNNEPCLHPAGHAELTREDIEKPRLLEGKINLSALDYSLKASVCVDSRSLRFGEIDSTLCLNWLM